MLIIRSPEELLEAYARMEDPDDPNVMLQEYVPGGDDTIWMFNGYFGAHSECHCAFTGRKLRQTPPKMGSTSMGICEPNNTVQRITIDFMRKIGYTGILDIGYRYDARDGQHKLLDPNPRIGSTFRLFVGTNGMDVVRYLYMDKTGQALPVTEPRWGRKWFVEECDLESFTIYRAAGELGLFQWLRSFRGVEESAWFAKDDIKPFWPTARAIAKRTLRFVGRTLRGRPRLAVARQPGRLTIAGTVGKPPSSE
jgi:D-aspartate ligase